MQFSQINAYLNETEIDLSKIKTLKIFKWLKNSGIKKDEMLKTFNCGVGFCLIIEPKNLNKISKFFSKRFQPYIIGKITRGNLYELMPFEIFLLEVLANQFKKRYAMTKIASVITKIFMY